MALARVVVHVLARALPHVLARVLLHVLARVIIHVHDYYLKTCNQGRGGGLPYFGTLQKDPGRKISWVLPRERQGS